MVTHCLVKGRKNLVKLYHTTEFNEHSSTCIAVNIILINIIIISMITEYSVNIKKDENKVFHKHQLVRTEL